MSRPSYWHIQTLGKPLYPDAEWHKPERRDQAGKLGIIGGNTLSFIAVAEAHRTALDTGAGQVRAVLPSGLRKLVPPTITDILYGQTTSSGGLANDATPELHALGDWANGLLMIGDAGRNSETAAIYEHIVTTYDGPLTITRDAIDLLKNTNATLVEREQTTIVASFAQLQKLLQSVYYPRVLTYAMQLAQLVDTLHKFTVTYPCTVVTLHKDTLLIAHSGEVITQEWTDTMAIWRGTVATRIATHWLWQPSNPLQAIATSIVK